MKEKEVRKAEEVRLILKEVGKAFTEFTKHNGRSLAQWVCSHGSVCQARVDHLLKDVTLAGGCQACKLEKTAKSFSSGESKAKRSAAAKRQFEDPAQLKLASDIKKAQFQDADFKEKHRQGCVDRWSSEGAREVQSSTLKQKINSDEVLKNVYAENARNATRTFIEKNPERAKVVFAEMSRQKVEFWSDPTLRASQSSALRLFFKNNPQAAARVSVRQRLRYESPEARKVMSDAWHSKPEGEKEAAVLKTRDSLFENKDYLLEASKVHESKDVVQQQIRDFVISLGFSPTFGYAKSLRGVVECDITIPEKNVGIECNGVLWHSDTVGRKSPDAKLQCTNAFAAQNIRVCHIEHFEWESQQDICKSYIRSLLGVSIHKVYARKCSVGYPTAAEQRAFYSRNHFLGYTASKLCLGLIYNGDWVSMLSLGKSNRSKHSNTVNRFATSLNTNCLGGFSKLMSKVPTELKHDLHTFIDLSKFKGESYTKTGWSFVEQQPVDYRVYYKDTIYNKSSWQKSRIREMFPDKDFGNMTEIQMTDSIHAYRVWDCGKLKLKYSGS